MGHSTPQFGERASFGPSDVCYRHKDRQTFTLCQRCGNNICSECQTQSAVGVLCPSCVKAAQPSRGVTANRRATRFARIASDPGTPTVTYTIIALCALVFVGQKLSSTVTVGLWYAPLYSLPEAFEPWRMFTVMFTHSTGNYFHILGNMFALWLFGTQLERSIGKIQFLLLYILAGWGGSLLTMLWGYTGEEAMRIPSVGASGAIFGVLGAVFVTLRHMNANVTTLAVLIGINLGIGFMPGSNISWQAHLGGMLTGAAVMLLLVRFRGPQNKTKRTLVFVLTTSVLATISFAYFFVHPLPHLL